MLKNMWLTEQIGYLRLVIRCLLIAAIIPEFILCLKNVSVTVPTTVKRGEDVLLECHYDLEGDSLYSVKWYKGRREFYRYTPKQNPSIKTFNHSGINVERNLSNQSHVMLSSVQLTISGKFSCEVSADAPSFHTLIVSGDLEVVELPTGGPFLTGIHSRYRLGDMINGNCTSNYSKPAANLTWSINDIPVPFTIIKIYEPLKYKNLESSIVELNFTVRHYRFIRDRIKLKCVARIHNIYEEEVVKIIEEDRPRILASGRSPDVSLFGFGNDAQTDGGLIDQNDVNLAGHKETDLSAASCVIVTRPNYAQISRSWYHRLLVYSLPEAIANRISFIVTSLLLNGSWSVAILVSIVATLRFNSTTPR